MAQFLRVVWKIFFYFRGYRPQKVTLVSLWKWISQFPPPIRGHLLLLLDDIIYFSEGETIRNLVDHNQTILDKLDVDGIGLDKVIYVAFDTAASSSHVMLNLLRDNENLERRGARLLGSRDAKSIEETTAEIQSGAIIYVDDFSGTGKQFIRNRTWSADFVVGSFSEFFLAPVICEEAIQQISETGVVPITNFTHTISQRPLHRNTPERPGFPKEDLVGLCHEINGSNGLGFKKLATMVVFYRNAPNSTPLLFRGNLKQSPYKGLFPRSDDLPY
jgi:hypothetical protein